MPDILTLSPKAAIYLASWIEGGINDESDAPDECADPALEFCNTINPIATKNLTTSLIICEDDEIDVIQRLVQTDLPSDPIDLLATSCARAYALLTATNAYDEITRSTRSVFFHELTKGLVNALQRELGRKAGLFNTLNLEPNSLGEALYMGEANTRQCLEAAEIAKQKSAAPSDSLEDEIDLRLQRGEITDLIEAVSEMTHQDPVTQAELLKKLERAAESIDKKCIDNYERPAS